MRLFLAVWPDGAALSALAALERPDLPGVRWTRPDQWHVTLRFFGDADASEVSGAVSPALPAGGVAARLGPACALLGRSVLQVPVDGLGDLASRLGAATARLGQPPRPGPFRGHLTLARARRPGDLRGLVGREVSAAWDVTELTLVSSVTARQGARYSVVERWGLQPGCH